MQDCLKKVYEQKQKVYITTGPKTEILGPCWCQKLLKKSVVEATSRAPDVLTMIHCQSESEVHILVLVLGRNYWKVTRGFTNIGESAHIMYLGKEWLERGENNHVTD